MRRLIAIVLLVLFGLSFAPPLVASVAMGDMKLRACCHKAAKQHCASMEMDGMDMSMDGMDMSSAMDQGDHAQMSPRMSCCGCCLFMMAAAGHADLVFLVTASAAVQPAPRSTRAGLTPQRTSLLEATWQQSGNKRGPPAPSLRNA